MGQIEITSFWYKCAHCDTEVSVSQSSALEEYDLLNCYKCGKQQRVMGLVSEPKIEVKPIIEPKPAPGDAK